MPDSKIRAAKIAVLRRLFDAARFEMPETYRAFLGHSEWLPPQQNALCPEPSGVVALNLSLRANGWFTSRQWPKAFLAIGEMDSDIIYFDTRREDDSVWFANHETSAASNDPKKCSGMEKLAGSFADYFADGWKQFIEAQGEYPENSEGDRLEFELLRGFPHPLLLETYFEDAAVRYEAEEAWNFDFGDYNLFFSIINLTRESAQELVSSAVDIAARQKTYGRLRAALCLVHRLAEKAGLKRLPKRLDLAVQTLEISVADLGLDDCEFWDAMSQLRGRSRPE